MQEGNIKDGGEYEFDLCRRGQQGSTPDICKDTVTAKHLVNTHTHTLKTQKKSSSAIFFPFCVVCLVPPSDPETYIHSAYTVNEIKASRLCLLHSETHKHKVTDEHEWVRNE